MSCLHFLFSHANSEYMYLFQISVGGRQKENVYISVITELKIIDGEMLSETVV